MYIENEFQYDVICPLCDGSHGSNTNCQRIDLRNMTYLNPIFKTPAIAKYVADLITFYNYRTFSDLPHTEKEVFAKLLLDCLGHSDEWNCVADNKYSDSLMFDLKKVLNGEKYAEEEFLRRLKGNIVAYFEDRMEAIFDYILESMDGKSFRKVAVKQYNEVKHV